MTTEHNKFLLKACEDYLIHMDECDRGNYLSFDFDFIKNKKWHTMGDSLVNDDLRDLTNIINRWQRYIYQWEAWNIVLKNKDEANEWDVRAEFVEPIVHQSLLMPSRIRDTFTSVSTSALHQIRLSIDNFYKDHLEGEQTNPGERPRFLNRRQKENRLFKLAKYWPESTSFITALQKINKEDYIEDTNNYRNLASHYIAPNLEMGETSLITRTVSPAKKIVPIGNNRYEEVNEPGKMSVCYGFGGTPPLNLKETHIKNLEQFNLARTCYIAYRDLLETSVKRIEESFLTTC